MSMPITTGAVHHIALTVRDVDSSSEFYRRLLGFQPIGAFGPKVLLTNGSVVLALGPAPHQPLPNDRFDENRLGLDHLSLSVAARADLEAMLQLLDEQGVARGAIVDLPAAQIAVLAFRDPDNIQIELTAPLP